MSPPMNPDRDPGSTAYSPGAHAAAWGVHLMTASGAVLGVFALLAVQEGNLHRAAVLMLVALFIDSADGTLARHFQVAKVVPWIDGRRLDDIVDYFNYVLVPAVFLVGAGSLTHPGWTLLPVLASAYGFSQTEAKTEDDFFLGWPSYWNVLAIYLWLLEIPAAWATAIVVCFTVMIFVPFKYLYPSKMRSLKAATGVMASVWIVLLTLSVLFPDRGGALRLVEVSLLFPAWYYGLSFWKGGLSRRTS
jgi:phosphatidylcholine synthase